MIRDDAIRAAVSELLTAIVALFGLDDLFLESGTISIAVNQADDGAVIVRRIGAHLEGDRCPARDADLVCITDQFFLQAQLVCHGLLCDLLERRTIAPRWLCDQPEECIC